MKPGNKLIIKSLDKGWCDNGTILLHGCFHLLADCIENEHLLSHKLFDWKQSEKAIQEKSEIKFLYKWWKKRIKREGASHIISDKQYEEDNSMLIRLIKISNRLWT